MKKTYISPVAREIALESEVVMQVVSSNGGVGIDGTPEDLNGTDAPVRLDIFNYGGLSNSGLGGE